MGGEIERVHEGSNIVMARIKIARKESCEPVSARRSLLDGVGKVICDNALA